MRHVFTRLAAFGLAVAAGLASLSTSGHAQQVTRDIVYTTAPTEQRADLYEPSGAGPFPVILYIHGGAWRSGNKSEYKRLGTDLATKGYAGFSINYDLHSDSFPISWQQARDAVRFLRAHATEYHLDPNRIGIAGASAGGELAALVALAPEGPPAPAVAGTPTPRSSGHHAEQRVRPHRVVLRHQTLPRRPVLQARREVRAGFAHALHPPRRAALLRPAMAMPTASFRIAQRSCSHPR